MRLKELLDNAEGDTQRFVLILVENTETNKLAWTAARTALAALDKQQSKKEPK